MIEGLLRDLLANLSSPSPTLAAELEALSTLLERKVTESAGAWPAIQVPLPEFVKYLAERLPDADPLSGLEAVNGADLYLACACVRGDGFAIRTLESQHFAMIESAVAQLRADPALIDEVKQIVREEVLVGVGGRKPSLSSYSGRGALGGWLRVTAVRSALRVLKKQGVCRDEPALADNLPGLHKDPELDHLKALYQQEFHQGVESAIRSLSDRDRNLLRYHYIDGLTVDDLAALYRAHRATVARWIAKARDDIFELTRQALTAKLDVGSSEYQSILRLIRSQMHITLSELLLHRPGADEAGPH